MRIFLGLVMMIGLTACQQNAEQAAVQGEPISASLYVRYLRDVGQLLAQAEFFEEDTLQQNGTSLELSEQVFVQNNPMRLVNVPGRLLQYRYQNQEGVQPNYTFRFHLPEGDEQIVAVEVPVIENFSVKAGIRKSTGMVLIIDQPLKDNEELQALFVDQDQQITPVTIQGPTRRNEIPLSAAAVRDLKLGDGFLYLLRRRTTPITLAKVDGVALSEFYTQQIAITVIE